MYSPNERLTVARLMKDTGTPYSTVGAPTPAHLVESVGVDLTQRIQDAPEELVDLFRDQARAALEGGNAEEVLARALVSMSGMKEKPKTRSLQAMKPGYVTLRLHDAESTLHIGSVGAFLGYLRRSSPIPEVSDDTARVTLTRAADGGQVVLFDVPEGVAPALLEAEWGPGVTVTQPTELGNEELSMAEGMSRDHIGHIGGARGSRGGRGGDRRSRSNGGFRDSRGSFQSDRRSGGSRDFRDRGSYGRGGSSFGRSDRRGSSRSAGGWEDWSDGGWSGDERREVRGARRSGGSERKGSWRDAVGERGGYKPTLSDDEW